VITERAQALLRGVLTRKEEAVPGHGAAEWMGATGSRDF